MTLDDLLKEAKKIKSVLQGEQKKKGFTELPYFYTLFIPQQNGFYYEGHYFGVGLSIPEVKQRQAIIEDNRTIDFYHIKLNLDFQRVPETIDISDTRKAYRLVRHDGFFGTSYKIIPLDKPFKAPS